MGGGVNLLRSVISVEYFAPPPTPPPQYSVYAVADGFSEWQSSFQSSH